MYFCCQRNFQGSESDLVKCQFLNFYFIICQLSVNIFFSIVMTPPPPYGGHPFFGPPSIGIPQMLNEFPAYPMENSTDGF